MLSASCLLVPETGHGTAESQVPGQAMVHPCGSLHTHPQSQMLEQEPHHRYPKPVMRHHFSISMPLVSQPFVVRESASAELTSLK